MTQDHTPNLTLNTRYISYSTNNSVPSIHQDFYFQSQYQKYKYKLAYFSEGTSIPDPMNPLNIRQPDIDLISGGQFNEIVSTVRPYK